MIRAIPNMGARINESMTLIPDPHDASAELVELTTWLFEQIGRVAEVSEAAYDVGAVMTGACYALTTVALEGLVDGALQQGLPRSVALEIAAQCFKGLARMLQRVSIQLRCVSPSRRPPARPLLGLSSWRGMRCGLLLPTRLSRPLPIRKPWEIAKTEHLLT